MGWGCSVAAGIRMAAINDWIIHHGGFESSNCWKDPKTGNSYFYELGREQRDGAITAKINRNISNTHCKPSGSMRIEPDGITMRGPSILKAVPAYELTIDGKYHLDWLVSRHGEPTEQTLLKYLIEYSWGFCKGGINQHVSNSLGYIPYPHSAKIVCLNNGNIVVEWKAPTFFVWPDPVTN